MGPILGTLIPYCPYICYMATMAPWGKYHGPQGPIKKFKGYAFFLATKAASLLWFGMVIGIDHPHTHNGNFVPFIAVCGPQGPIFKYKGPAFS